MAYEIPQFNLFADIFTGAWTPFSVPRLTVPCQLYFPRQGILNEIPSSTGAYYTVTYLRVPKLTDVRGPLNAGGADSVRVPAGLNRLYRVVLVDDVHRGFPNEYRVALIQAYGSWPNPIP